MSNLYIHSINFSQLFPISNILINIHEYNILVNLHIGPLSKHVMYKH